MAPSILLRRVKEDDVTAPSAPVSSKIRPGPRECLDACQTFSEEQSIPKSRTLVFPAAEPEPSPDNTMLCQPVQ